MRTKGKRYLDLAAVLAGLGVAASSPHARAQCGLQWPYTSSWSWREVWRLNDPGFITADPGGCFNWENFLHDNAPPIGWSIAYVHNSYLGNPGPVEWGALFYVRGSNTPQVFDVYVLYKEGGFFGVPPPAYEDLQVHMRQNTAPNEFGLDVWVDLPLVEGSIRMLGESIGQDVCWRHARIVLPQAIEQGGDYWFCVLWSPNNANDTFTLAVDADSPHGALVAFDDGYWHRQGADPMIVVVQDPAANEPPFARINGPDAGGTGLAITLDGQERNDGSGSTGGTGPNCAPDYIQSYAWSLITRPQGSAAVLSSTDQPTTSFTPDIAGDYVVQLIVNDRYEASTPATHTITVTQTPPPRVGAPQITPAAVHAQDYETVVSLSATVTDSDPNATLEYLWTMRNIDTGATWTSAEVSPTLTIDELPDVGFSWEDTYFEVTLRATNTRPDPDLATTGPASAFRVSRWPRITVMPQGAAIEWGQAMTYDLPVVVRIQAAGVPIDIDGLNLQLTRPDLTTVLDEETLSAPGMMGAGDLRDYLLNLHNQLVWDQTWGCLSPLPTGPISRTEALSAVLYNVSDENGFMPGVVDDLGQALLSADDDVQHEVTVPSYKIVWYGDANRYFVLAEADSIKATFMLLGAPGVCAVGCLASGPLYPACFGGCIAATRISAAILFAAQAYHLHEAALACNDAHDDPPTYDPDYMTVVPVSLPEIDTTSALAGDDMTRLALAAAEQGGLLSALDTAYGLTYNKLFGAYQAGQQGDPNARNGMILQGTELIRLGGALDRERSTQLDNLLVAQAAVGVPAVEEVIAFQQMVAADGLPQREIEVLQQLGADQAEIDTIISMILNADPTVLAAGVSDTLNPLYDIGGDFYSRHSQGVAPGGYVLVAVADPLRDRPVRGTINIDARVVHKKDASGYCGCGPTIMTSVTLDGQQPPLNSVPYPPGPYCPAPPGPPPQAVPVQLDTTTLPDGPHTITVTARDSGLCPPVADPREHMNTDTITIYVDNTPPTLTITAPDVDPQTAGVQVYAGDDITYDAADPQVNGYASGLVDPDAGVRSTLPGFGHDQTIRVADRAGNVTETTVQVIALPEGQVATIENAAVSDGHLEATLDEYGSMQILGGSPNVDRFDPAGTATEQTPTFTAGTFLFVGTTHRELLSASLDWQDHVWPSGSSFSDDTTLARALTSQMTASDATPGDGVNDTLASSFTLLGLTTDGQAISLTCDLTQFVSEPEASGAAFLQQDYAISNTGAVPVTLKLVRVYDGDLPWTGSPAYADDWVGADQAAGIWYVFQQEPDDARLALTLSSLTPADAYFGGKAGVDPDGPGGSPAFGPGTSARIWDAYGVPAAWRNYVAGVGYNTPGTSGSRPPGSAQQPDAHVGLQFELTLQPGEQQTLTLVHSYGATQPLVGTPCPGDLDGDRVVGLADLALLLASYGTDAGGDLDGDGDTDLTDLALLLAAYGTPCP